MKQDELEGPSPGSVDPELVQLAFREARNLIRAMEGTAVLRLRVRVAGLEVEVTRGDAALSQPPAAPPVPATGEPGLQPVLAPLVGVFYRAPSPGARPFVEVGDPVVTGQVVGIVEAMKVLNQVTSEHSGRVVEILVDDGTPVQYAQQLLLIDTTDAGRPGAEL